MNTCMSMHVCICICEGAQKLLEHFFYLQYVLIEKVNQSLKNRIRYDMTVNSNEGVNWVEELPVYDHLYNTSPHQALGASIHLRKPYW